MNVSGSSAASLLEPQSVFLGLCLLPKWTIETSESLWTSQWPFSSVGGRAAFHLTLNSSALDHDPPQRPSLFCVAVMWETRACLQSSLSSSVLNNCNPLSNPVFTECICNLITSFFLWLYHKTVTCLLCPDYMISSHVFCYSSILRTRCENTLFWCFFTFPQLLCAVCEQHVLHQTDQTKVIWYMKYVT